MDIIVERFEKIKSNINKLGIEPNPKIIAVSKTFTMEHVIPLVNY